MITEASILEKIAGVPTDTMGISVLLKGPHGSGTTIAARRLHAKIGGPYRAPHYTVSEIGAISELALAAGGVLMLDETAEFRIAVLRAIGRTWALMHPRARPVLILTAYDTADLARINKWCGDEFTIDCTVELAP